MKRSNTAEFIKAANQIHNNKYDYSLVEYTGNTNKVTIVCPEHGTFKQIPASHLSGSGCPTCAHNIRKSKQTLTTYTFIKNAQMAHGKLYDYSQAVYIEAKSKVKIICTIHGEFEQTPSNHVFLKQGCQKCAGNHRPNIKEFIIQAQTIHGFNRYDYSQVVYKNNRTKVIILCTAHGKFTQTPASHLSGAGCPICAGNHRPNIKEFIIQAQTIHGFNKYDYSMVQYKNANTKINIICSVHGMFSQTPNCHIGKAATGCPNCSKSISKQETEWLGSLGVLQRQANIYCGTKRFKVDGFNPTTNTVYEFLGDYWHGNPTVYNHNEYNAVTKCTFGELYATTIKKQQAIINAGYNLVEMWESDWNQVKKR